MVNFYNCIIHIKLWKQKEKKQILFFFFVLLVLLLLLLLLWYCLVQFFFAFVFVLSKIPCCCFAGFACGNLSCENSLFHVFLLLLFCYFHIFFIPLKEEETTENRKEGRDGRRWEAVLKAQKTEGKVTMMVDDNGADGESRRVWGVCWFHLL